MKELTIVIRVGGKEVYGSYSTCDVFVSENCRFSTDEHILNCIYDVHHDRLVDNWIELDEVCGDIALAIRERMYDELEKEREI